jgi:hypothetical protein
MSQALLDRIVQLKQAIEQSAANHHALVGRLTEATDLLKILFPVTAPVVDAVNEVACVVDAALGGAPNAT